MTPSPTSCARGVQTKGSTLRPDRVALGAWGHGASSPSKATSPTQDKTRAPAAGWPCLGCAGGSLWCVASCARDAIPPASAPANDTIQRDKRCLCTGDSYCCPQVLGQGTVPIPASWSVLASLEKRVSRFLKCCQGWNTRGTQQHSPNFRTAPLSVTVSLASPEYHLYRCNQGRLPWKPFIRCS